MARPPLNAAAEPSDRRRAVILVAAFASVIAVPIGVTLGMAWVELPGSRASAAAAPEWVSLPSVRATTRDGMEVNVRVAIDTADSATRSSIQRSTQQIVLLLETSVAAHVREDLSGARGIGTLGGDMRFRLNRWLAAEGVASVRQVVVQDLLVNSP